MYKMVILKWMLRLKKKLLAQNYWWDWFKACSMVGIREPHSSQN
jgi:hypothetical protein